MTAAAMPVRPGTAEQLAVLTHFRDLDLPEIRELDGVARFLIGDVGDTHEAPVELWRGLHDECQRLWHLISDDWDDRDLDELHPGYDEDQGLDTEQRVIEARYDLTRSRLECAIETTIWLARFQVVEARRIRVAS